MKKTVFSVVLNIFLFLIFFKECPHKFMKFVAMASIVCYEMNYPFLSSCSFTFHLFGWYLGKCNVFGSYVVFYNTFKCLFLVLVFQKEDVLICLT